MATFYYLPLNFLFTLGSTNMFIRILQVTGLKNFPTAIITDKRVDACFRTLCFKLKFLAYKKRQTHEKKSPIFFSTFFLCNFSVRTLQCFQKKIFFFDHKKLKKPSSKVAHSRPKPVISQSSPAHSSEPRIDFSYYKMSGTSICSLICDNH